ncbi:hypothetical protein C1646_767947 [Rhizophagus diaphanus]|nr:hypothetical protein C1646_767947 [Rhizophagus diaphanus] [Rhizophagus sp. MUCL 43196]
METVLDEANGAIYTGLYINFYYKDNGKENITDKIDVNEKHIQQKLNITKTFYRSWWSFIRKLSSNGK